MAVQIQIRRDTAANWTSVNPILASGEQGLETDTGKIKFGNGSSAWNSLPYFLQSALDAKQDELPNFTANEILVGDGTNVPVTDTNLTFVGNVLTVSGGFTVSPSASTSGTVLPVSISAQSAGTVPAAGAPASLIGGSAASTSEITGSPYAGGDVSIRGGNGAGTSSGATAKGGDITITGGVGGGCSNFRRTMGGTVTIRAGRPNSNSAGSGGDINLFGGDGSYDGNGGNFVLTAGIAGSVLGNNRNGGSFAAAAGQGANNGNGGNVSFNGGRSLGSGLAGDVVFIPGGVSVDTTGGGNVIFELLAADSASALVAPPNVIFRNNNEASGVATVTARFLYDGKVFMSDAPASSAVAKLEVHGLGATSATQSVAIHNSTGSSNSLIVRDDGAIGVGTATPDTSALLDVTSTAKGFLFPRMTTAQKNAIASPASGLVVYDTTLNKLCVRGATAWETITSI